MPAESTLTSTPLPPLPGDSLSQSVQASIDSTREIEPSIHTIDSAEERDGGDSDDEGEVMNLHIIGVARALVDDNECVAVDSIADAERIILSNVNQPNTNHDINDDIREPSESNGNGTVCGLIGAP